MVVSFIRKNNLALRKTVIAPLEFSHPAQLLADL